MRHFNSRVFLVFIVFFTVVTYFSFNAAYARDEGVLRLSSFRVFLADCFNVFRFPTHVILARFMGDSDFFVMGLIVNCAFYGLLCERIIYFIFFRRQVAE